GKRNNVRTAKSGDGDTSQGSFSRIPRSLVNGWQTMARQSVASIRLPQIPRGTQKLHGTTVAEGNDEVLGREKTTSGHRFYYPLKVLSGSGIHVTICNASERLTREYVCVIRTIRERDAL
ncbi:hypothetical protein V1477_005085, partial [Vespula maculifrons]